MFGFSCESCVLFRATGGRIETVYLFQPSLKQVVSVIDNNHENATAMLGVSNWRGLMLIPYANRINNAQYSFNGTLYTLPMNEPTRNNSIHGRTCLYLFLVSSVSPCRACASSLAVFRSMFPRVSLLSRCKIARLLCASSDPKVFVVFFKSRAAVSLLRT